MRPLNFNFYSLFFALFLGVFISSVLISFGIAKIAKRKGLVDSASLDPNKKKHSGSVPLLVGSGAVLFATLCMAIVAFVETSGILSYARYTHIGGWNGFVLYFCAAIVVLLVGGYLDDKYHIKARHQLFFVVVAVLIVLSSGITLSFSNVLGFNAPWFDILVTALWLFLCTGSTKFLDGHDGIVTTVGIIGFGGIASVALIDRIQDPLFATFALVWMFALVGFLPFNFPKARAYLGEGASWAIGFAIGFFSLVISSKLLIANAVIGLFLLDLILVWVIRYKQGRNFLTSADRMHWHHRLQIIGLDKLQVLVLTTCIVLLNTHVAIWLALHHYHQFSILQMLGFVATLVVVSMLLKKPTKKVGKEYDRKVI